MLEELGDMWRMKGDAVCITTNGVVRRDGRAVMGRGVARQVKERYPRIDLTLGQRLKALGNHVFLLSQEPVILSFPVKHDWRDKADIELIQRSCVELMAAVNALSATRATKGLSPLERVLLPRPGCGAGGLEWTDVQPRIAPLLDDRVIVVAY